MEKRRVRAYYGETEAFAGVMRWLELVLAFCQETKICEVRVKLTIENSHPIDLVSFEDISSVASSPEDSMSRILSHPIVILSTLRILNQSIILYKLASNDENIVIIIRKVTFSLFIIYDVVSCESMENIGCSHVHRVIVVPQTPRRLHIFISVHLERQFFLTFRNLYFCSD